MCRHKDPYACHYEYSIFCNAFYHSYDQAYTTEKRAIHDSLDENR